MTDTTKNLMNQLNILCLHNRQGSFETKRRYRAAMARFLEFCGSKFGLQKLANLSEKHLIAYVKWMQKKGMSASTIKTDLAAIRFWHDKISDAKFKLPENSELGVVLEKRHTGTKDKAWSDKEVADFIQVCIRCGHDDYAQAAMLAALLGLRIHEVLRLDTAAVEAACREDVIWTKGKGGRKREIPVSTTALGILVARKRAVRRGSKLFVPDDKKTRTVISDIEAFIRAHRDEFQDPSRGPENPAVFHGLRHKFAGEKLLGLLREGKSKAEAKWIVSKLLGHNRPEVVGCYTGPSLRKQLLEEGLT